MTGPLIRPARDADGPGIAAVMRAVFDAHPGCVFLIEEFPELTAGLATHVAAHDGAAWVVEADGVVQGSLGVVRTNDPRRFELIKVYLAAELRGQGLAPALVELAAAHARARGGTILELFTDTRFHAGHRFYERQGFVRVPGERCLGTFDEAWEWHYLRQLSVS